MRREYERLTFSVIRLEPGSRILAGSKTSVPIKVQEVTVDPFTQGFGSGADDDFKSVSFD